MGKYTIELRKICDIYTRNEVENWFKDYQINDFLQPFQIESIEKAGIWNKDKLAKKIVDHYYMREIGFETPFLFQHYAKITMNEIMEEKLPLIYSNSFNYDPLINVDFTETFDRNYNNKGNNAYETSGHSQQNSNTNASNSGLNVNSDTPQGQINKNEILNGTYASSTNASQNDNQTLDETNIQNSSYNTSNANSQGKEKYTRHQKGNSGVLSTYQKLIQQYRDIIIAIDKDIIKELNTLFMGLY